MTTIRKTIEVSQIIVSDHLCNKCGKTCCINREMEQYAGIIEKFAEGCYGSNYLEDGTMYIFSMCEKCTKELFDSFILPVDIMQINIW